MFLINYLNYVNLDFFVLISKNEMQTQKSIALKPNMKKVWASLLPLVKKMITNKINRTK